MRFAYVFLIAACTTFIAGCNSAAKDAPPAPTPVRVAAATTGPAAPSIRTNGLLANRDEIRLAFKVGGVIKRLAAAEGEPVRKGQKLAEIEQTEVNAQVEQARQACEKAKRDVARGERLYADKVISLEQLQDLRTQAAMAEASLNSAEFNWNYAAIVAPRDGTVLRRLAEEREVVAAGAQCWCSARKTEASSFAPDSPTARSCRCESAMPCMSGSTRCPTPRSTAR